MDVYPDFGATTGAGLGTVLGALLTIVLIVAVLMILISAIAWAIASSNGNPAVAQKAKAGLWVGVAAAALAGAAVAWLNFLIGIGNQL
ncbi:MAG: DUF6112 family protein [Brachybacterium sp.]